MLHRCPALTTSVSDQPMHIYPHPERHILGVQHSGQRIQITACTSEGGSVTTRCTFWATIRHALWGKCPALRSLPLALRTSCGERSTPQTADYTREVLEGIEQSYLGRKALGHGRKAQQLMRQRLVDAAGGLLRKEIVERAAGEARQRAKALHRGTAAVKRRTSQS